MIIRWCCRSWRKSKKPSGRQPDISAARPDLRPKHFARLSRADPEGLAAQRFRAACAAAGLESSLTVTYGGSDNNHFCQHGLTGLVVAPGMNACHSCQEYTSADELTRAARLAEALIVSRK